MNYLVTPSVRLVTGIILLLATGADSSSEAQPPVPPPPPPAPGVDTIPPVPETEMIPIVDPSLIQDDIPPTRFGISHQIFGNGFDEPFTDIRLFAPIGDDERVLFFDGRLLFGNDIGISGIGYNFGVGARKYLEQKNAVFGINLFGDRRQTTLHQYHQIGVGWELLSDRWELRNNFYIPVGTRRVVTASTPIVNPQATPYFRENFISVDTTQSLQNFEQVLRGLDLEFGGRLNRPEQGSGNWLLRGYAGFYYYQNPDLGDLPGASIRLNANYRDAVVTNVDVRHDEYFGTQANVGVTLYMDGLFDRNQTFHSRTQDVRNHLARPVQRKQYITAIRDQGVVASAGIVDLTDPDTGLPITVTHVDSNSGGNDLGTFEDPFLTLTDADASANDIVYVHADSSYDGQSFALIDGQRLLGEGGGFQNFVDTSELGTIVLPDGNGGTDKPIILNAPGDAVTLASNTEVANLQITTPGLSGLYGNGAIDALVNAVMVTDPVDSGATFEASDVDVIDSMFSISARLVPGIEAINGSIVDISGTQITAATGPGLFVSDTSSATVTNGSSILVSDNLGIFGTDDAMILVDDSDVMSSFEIAILLADNATAIVQNGSDLTVGGHFGSGVQASGTSHFELLSGSSITSTATGLDGDRAYGILVEDLATVLIDNGTITTAGSGASGIYWIPNASGASWITVQNNSTIMTTGNATGPTVPASAIFSEAFNVNHDSVLTITDSLLSTAGTDSEALRLNLSGTWTANITGTTITSSMSDEILLTPGASGTMNMTIFDNILESGSGTVVLDNSAGGTIDISGPMFMSLSDFATSNGIPNGNIMESGTITYTPSP